MLQTIPSFYAKISEEILFNSAKTYEKYIVSKDYCIAYHDDKTCSLPACIYHEILHGEIEELSTQPLVNFLNNSCLQSDISAQPL